jgi:hypothetical protein
MALPLDRAFTQMGKDLESKRRAHGLYPDQELNLPSNEDLNRHMGEFMRDFQTRAQKGQLNPGEDMRVEGGRAQISGFAAVMGLNARLTRDIFEKNPRHEFYVEESYPLDWMYPHLTPFGIIMKLERQAPVELSLQVVERDRRFWRDYMTRLIGDWVSPDTNIADICTFAERVHLRKDLAAFHGDPKFLRDEQAQKGFSKLRSSIGGLYDWRFRSATGQLQQVSQQLGRSGLNEMQIQELRAQQLRLTNEQSRMYQEAEFALKQSYALCPFSPEAFQRLVNLLVSVGRVNDALTLAETSKKLDPGNAFYTNIAAQIRQMSNVRAGQTAS